MTVESSLAEAAEKMHKATAHLKEDLATVRTGRAAPSLLNRVTVEYYGAPTPLNQLATISVPEPRLLLIAPFDKTSIPTGEPAAVKGTVMDFTKPMALTAGPKSPVIALTA